MPPAETTPGLDAGLQLEVRVAQAWFWDGYYVRRGVDLQHRFGSDISTVTDLDILAYSFDSALASHTYIGEVKGGRSSSTPRPLDRALWARGLRELVGAENAEVTTAFRASAGVRDFARSFGVVIQHVDDLAVRESRLRMPTIANTGSQGDAVALTVREVQKHLKSDPELERAFWFLRSEVWFLAPFDATKRTLGLLRQLQSSWPAETDIEGTKAVRWLYAESLSVLALQLTLVCGYANTMSGNEFREVALDKLAAGDLPAHAMRRLSERVDEYVAKIMQATDAPAELKTTAMGAFVPTPPDYAEPLTELVRRLSANPSAMAQVPRAVDLIVFERLVRRREASGQVRRRLLLSDETLRLIRLIGSFLRGQIGLPGPVDRALSHGQVDGEDLQIVEDGGGTLF